MTHSKLWAHVLSNMTVSGDEEDVLNRPDTISLEELETTEQSQMDRAGIMNETAADTFIGLNGDKIYVTEI
jgi:hypothetical protein